MLGRKGLSDIVAALMLISIVVAASIILYVYSSGLLGSLQGAQPQQPYVNQIVLEYYNWPTSNLNNLTLYLRNTGSGRGLLADFFVNGTKVTLTKGSCVTYTTTALTPGSTCTAVLTISGLNIKAGYAYIVKLVTKDGSIFSYSLVAGQSGPPV
jgi:hypothetical protein